MITNGTILFIIISTQLIILIHDIISSQYIIFIYIYNCYKTIILISNDVLIIMIQVEEQVNYYDVRGNIARYVDVSFCLQCAL